jgi:hypothetical protein
VALYRLTNSRLYLEALRNRQLPSDKKNFPGINIPRLTDFIKSISVRDNSR